MIALALLLSLQDASAPGEPVPEPSTLHCLAAYWIIRGDANQNARVDVAVRTTGGEGKKVAPFRRVERGRSRRHRKGNATTQVS